MGTIKTFEDLECWKACTEVRRYTMKIVQKFPAQEKFELSNQMKRSSRSTTHNIAEGFGRFHFKENIRFCRHSKGSLMELVDQYITALDEGYITNEEYKFSKELIDKAVRILNGYINYLRKNTNNNSSYVSDVEMEYFPSSNN